MSTPGVVGFFCNGDFKVMFNKWDSYPSDLGKKVVAFCRTLGQEKIRIAKKG